MDPQQELFTTLKFGLEAEGFTVYDVALPPEGTAYPFIYLADSNARDEVNKTAIFGRVTQIVHFWHNDPEQRGTLSEMMLQAKRVARKIERQSTNFGWLLISLEQRILADNSTSKPLMHGVLELEYRFG